MMRPAFPLKEAGQILHEENSVKAEIMATKQVATL